MPVGAIDTGRDHNENPFMWIRSKWTGLRRVARDRRGQGDRRDQRKAARWGQPPATPWTACSLAFSRLTRVPGGRGIHDARGPNAMGVRQGGPSAARGNKYIGRLKGPSSNSIPRPVRSWAA